MGGIVASAFGDAFLVWPAGFLAGMGSFALGHLCYIVSLDSWAVGQDARIQLHTWGCPLLCSSCNLALLSKEGVGCGPCIGCGGSCLHWVADFNGVAGRFSPGLAHVHRGSHISYQ